MAWSQVSTKPFALFFSRPIVSSTKLVAFSSLLHCINQGIASSFPSFPQQQHFVYGLNLCDICLLRYIPRHTKQRRSVSIVLSTNSIKKCSYCYCQLLSGSKILLSKYVDNHIEFVFQVSGHGIWGTDKFLYPLSNEMHQWNQKY